MKKLFILVFVLFISGCSTKFAYRNLDWLAYWYVDDYLELTDEQEDVIDPKLEKWLAWHKENELPKYVEHLKNLIDDISNGNVTVDRIGYHQEKVRSHWVRIREHIASDLVELAPILSDEQITYMFATIEKENKEREEEIQERLSLEKEKRTKRRYNRSIDQAEDWIGRLNSEQKELISEALPKLHSTSQLWLEYRRVYLNELRLLFAAQERGDVFDKRLTELIVNPEHFRSDELLHKSAENTEINKKLLVSIYNLTSEKQRSRLIKEISDYEDDFNELMLDE